MRLLLVEDNRELSEWLAKALEHSRYTVDRALTGEQGDTHLRTAHYDLVILDLSLPDIDGREVLRRLRSRGNTVPVLILSAHDGVNDRITGLDQGADDYLTKPFDLHELEARMRALLRRDSRQKSPVTTCGSLAYDSNSREFSDHGLKLVLTPREHAVLEVLFTRMGKTVSKRALADSLYSIDEDVSPEAIEIYVHRIRRKLEGSSATIVTLRGLGYILKAANEAA